jgi:hypothetical protein
MMLKRVVVILGVTLLASFATFAAEPGKPASSGFENRCGWVENPRRQLVAHR